MVHLPLNYLPTLPCSLPGHPFHGALPWMTDERELQPSGRGLEFPEEVREGDPNDQTFLRSDVQVNYKVFGWDGFHQEVEIATGEPKGLC